MATKEVRALLKSARNALDKQEYEEAIKHCEAVLWSETDNYLAHIIAGKALLLSGKMGEAKRYYKKATALNEKEILAWKGLVDLYDKHNHDGTEDDVLTALSAYRNVLETTQNDDSKRIVMALKLAGLYKKTKQIEKACEMYVVLLKLAPSLDIVEEGVVFILREGAYPRDNWNLLRDSYFLLVEGVAGDARMELINSYINGVMNWIKLLVDEDCEMLLEQLKDYCTMLLAQCNHGNTTDDVMMEKAVGTLCKIELWRLLKDTDQSDYRLRPLLDDQKEVFTKGEAYSLCYAAILLADKRQLKAACEAVNKSVLDPANTLSEHWAVAVLCHMMSHDYHMVISDVKKGFKNLSECPLFLQATLKNTFNVYHTEALVCSEQFDKALQLIKEELQDVLMSCDCHVTQLHVRALIGCGRIVEAEKIVSTLAPPTSDHIIKLLKALIAMAGSDYQLAIKELQDCVAVEPNSPQLLYHLGAWQLATPTEDKKQAYQNLLKAARLDPFNPLVYLQLGCYHRNVTKDLSRAVKCFQKSFSSPYAPLAAGLALGGVHSSLGNEESAFTVYNKVINTSLATQTKEAWLWVGLHHRKHGRYEEAIKCFLTVLRQDFTDYQVWECIGEAYQMRGSQTSALKAFARAIELNSGSLYCQYQVAAIQHSLGIQSSAIDGYSAVLRIDHTYVPALKGRAEVYFNQAEDALLRAFDQKAVELVGLALKDLSRAVVHQPSFSCLWKLAGDSCLCLSPVTFDLISVPVSSCLITGNRDDLDVEKTLDKSDLINLAISCYGRALQLNSSHASSPVYHNLSLAYKTLAELHPSDEVQNLSASLALIKKAVSLSPSNSLYWNTLGVVASHPVLAIPSLAQHAFIKSLEIDSNNAEAWSNLGSLYLTKGNIQLAHHAFTRAQSSDPAHSEGWVGEGLVAETIGKGEEAMDFFHIALDLKYHPESALGFAQWVCRDLSASNLTPPTPDGHAHLKVIQARDDLTRYVHRNPQDPLGLNLLGVLYEQDGLVSLAEESIAKARGLIIKMGGASNSDELLCTMKNHARLLSCKGEFAQSLETYAALDSLATPLSVDYALALHRAGKFEEATIAYDDFLSSFDAGERPFVLLACAMSLFGEGNHEDSKNKLFKVFQTPPPIVHGMISLATFAGYSNDVILLHATLNEIEKIIDFDSASISKLHPSCHRILKSLSHHLANNHQGAELRELIARICTKFPIDNNLKPLPVIQEVLEVIVGQSPDQSVLTVQRIIHDHPDNLWAWSLLCYVLFVLGRVGAAKSTLQIVTFKAQQLSKEVQKSAKLLQLRTNELQTVQLLLSWTKNLKTAS